MGLVGIEIFTFVYYSAFCAVANNASDRSVAAWLVSEFCPLSDGARIDYSLTAKVAMTYRLEWRTEYLESSASHLMIDRSLIP